MRRVLLSILTLGILLIPAPVLGQSTLATASSDSQTLQALLREVHQLRQDVRTVTTTAGRAQILLSRLQVQQTAAASAQKELDAADSSLAQGNLRVRTLENQVKYYSDQDTDDRTPNPADRQRIEDMLARLKSTVEEANAQEQQDQAAEMNAKQRLQIEQSRLSALQDELDQIDKALQDFASQPVN